MHRPLKYILLIFTLPPCGTSWAQSKNISVMCKQVSKSSSLIRWIVGSVLKSEILTCHQGAFKSISWSIGMTPLSCHPFTGPILAAPSRLCLLPNHSPPLLLSESPQKTYCWKSTAADFTLMPYYISLKWQSSDCVMTTQKLVQIPATTSFFLLTMLYQIRAEGYEE